MHAGIFNIYLCMMLGKRALVALAFVRVGGLGEVSAQNFTSRAYRKPTTMIFAHVGCKFGPGFRLDNSVVHYLTPQAIEIALGENLHLGLIRIVFVKTVQFFNPVVLDVPAQVTSNRFLR